MFTGMGEARNVINVLTSDVVVACGVESAGTISEIALALKAGPQGRVLSADNGRRRMLICQWHLDVRYGKQAEAVRVMRAWGKEKFASSEFRRARGARLMAGAVGASASHLIDEYWFDSLADFEAALAGMAAPQFRSHSEALAPYVVPGSQCWIVYRALDET